MLHKIRVGDSLLGFMGLSQACQTAEGGGGEHLLLTKSHKCKINTPYPVLDGLSSRLSGKESGC